MHRALTAEAAPQTMLAIIVERRRAVGANHSGHAYGVVIEIQRYGEGGLDASKQEHRQDQQPRNQPPSSPQCGLGHSLLPSHPADGIDQLVYLVPLLYRVPRAKSIPDAVRHVVSQNLLLNLMQGSAYRIDLSQNVDAIPIILDHTK